MKFPKFARTRKLFNTRKKRLIAAIVLIIIFALSSWLILNRPGADILDTTPKTYYSKLTGKKVSKDASEQPILGIMIENSEEARPQTGLDSAGIVFETTTEAGITRYLALYQDEVPKTVGPVRSVRPAFVDWVMGFEAPIAHVGGSPEALSLIDSRKSPSLNQFYNDGPYSRSSDRSAPHNMYASVTELIKLSKDKKFESNYSDSFERTIGQADENVTSTKINVEFSIPIFGTQYRYNKEDNTYTRYLAGEPHIDDAIAKPITISNLVVMQMGANVKAVGTGKVFVFKNGVVTEGKWEKTSYDKQIRLYTTVDGQDQNITLNQGQTWFAAIPSTGSVKY